MIIDHVIVFCCKLQTRMTTECFDWIWLFLTKKTAPRNKNQKDTRDPHEIGEEKVQYLRKSKYEFHVEIRSCFQFNCNWQFSWTTKSRDVWDFQGVDALIHKTRKLVLGRALVVKLWNTFNILHPKYLRPYKIS